MNSRGAGRAAPVSRTAPGAGRRSGRGERGFGRPPYPSGNLGLVSAMVGRRKSALASRGSPPLVGRATPLARHRPSTWRDTSRAPIQSVSLWWGPSQGRRRGQRLQGLTCCAAQGAGQRTAASNAVASMSTARGRGMATRAEAVMYVNVEEEWVRRVRVAWACRRK